MPIKYTRVGWQDAPSMETPIDAANLNHMDNGILALSEAYDTEIPTVQQQFRDVLSEVRELKQLVNQPRCHVGMIIHSTTLDTEAKVKAQYGGDTWIQHVGYFLLGDDDGVSTNNAVSDGGEPMHMLTVDEMPSHRHGLINELQPPSYNYGCVAASGSVSNSSIGSSGATQNTNYAGGGQPHNNMPPYKKVYIWECVVVDSVDDPILIEDP